MNISSHRFSKTTAAEPGGCGSPAAAAAQEKCHRHPAAAGVRRPD